MASQMVQILEWGRFHPNNQLNLPAVDPGEWAYAAATLTDWILGYLPSLLRYPMAMSAQAKPKKLELQFPGFNAADIEVHME